MSTSLRIACVRVPRAPTGAPAPAEAWARLAGALLVVAPRVCPLGEGGPLGAWADATGMERRGGDAAVAQGLLAAAREAGFGEARVGVAGTCVAAALATRERGSAWRVVPPGRDREFVGRRALSMLPMSDDLRSALDLLGVRLCGDLGRLAAGEVELRFGAEGLRVWRLARGDDARWPFRPAAAQRAAAEVDLEPPVENSESLRFLLPGLISSVLEQMGVRQRIPAALRLRLRLEGSGAESVPVRPARPTADARVLADLCWRALQERRLEAPVAGVRLEEEEEGAARADQLDVFRPPAPDPSAVHAALLPLLARWGEEALSRAVQRGAHLPAEQAAWEAMGARAIPALARRPAALDPPPPRPDLPLHLRRHGDPPLVPVEVDTLGRPRLLHLAGQPLRLSTAGPERISGRWWDDGYAREYWLCEDEHGCLRLLFRDGCTDEWRWEGWYD